MLKIDYDTLLRSDPSGERYEKGDFLGVLHVQKANTHLWKKLSNWAIIQGFRRGCNNIRLIKILCSCTNCSISSLQSQVTDEFKNTWGAETAHLQTFQTRHKNAATCNYRSPPGFLHILLFVHLWQKYLVHLQEEDILDAAWLNSYYCKYKQLKNKQTPLSQPLERNWTFLKSHFINWHFYSCQKTRTGNMCKQFGTVKIARTAVWNSILARD